MSPLQLVPQGLNELGSREIKEQASLLVFQVEDGNIDPLLALVLVKKQMELLKDAEKGIRAYVEGVTHLVKGEVIKKYSCEIISKEAGVKYNFSYCGDSTWNNLQYDLAELEAKIKKREDFLKALQGEMADPETGEIIRPATRTAKVGLNITIK